MTAVLAPDWTDNDSPITESLKVESELLGKFLNMSKTQVLSYLNAPTSYTNDITDQLSRDTIPFKPPTTHFMVKRPSVSLLDKFIALHKWQGIVLEVGNGSFFAKLVSLNGKDPDEEAEFSVEEVSKDDWPFIRAGAVFYWSIGYFDFHKGQRLRASIIRFRRLPAWTRKELDDANKRATEIRDFFGWQEPQSSTVP
jgi:hypothetical protein